MTWATDEYIRETCKVGQRAACCRYLMMGSKGWRCAKLDALLKKHLDQRVEAHSMSAQGDNCAGKA
jgi:hypothetical protein